MKPKILKILPAIILLLPWLPTPASASLSSWQKGVSIQSMYSGDFSSSGFKQSVDNAASIGANYIALVFNIYQSNVSSTDIQNGGDTPTDQALADAIDYVHSKGLKVMLKPHLESYTGEWRANINPSDRQSWFNNYDNFILHYAQIGQSHGAEDFCIGTELINMSTATANPTNTQNWENLIAAMRKVFSGRLTYSANWGSGGFADEKNNIQFWGGLDYIGISAYFNLSGDNSVSNLENQWNNYNNNDIKPLSQRFNKPVVFTEVGYRSVTNAHTQPWDYNLGGSYDPTEQSNDYQALVGYWQNQSFMQGIELWQWSSNPNAGGSGNTDYTPQNKPAQDTLKQLFGSGPAQPPAGFSATASASPATVSSGQGISIAATITATGGQAAGILVDAEIYNSSGQRVAQNVFDNQDFSNGQSRTYNFSYTPTVNGNFKVKLGVFNYNWSQLYVWNDSAATFGANGGSGGGGSGAGPINIWWPTNGVTVSGIQPFKAMLANEDVSQYNMYWQVDGGSLVTMNNNSTDYPHKEFDVNLVNWTWHGTGPYTVNFIAKDLSGNTIIQSSVQIYVSH